MLLAGAAIQPAAAAPIKWLAVQLGSHQFGRLKTPDSIVAQAGAGDVGFSGAPKGGCGCGDVPHGPMVFDVGRDGSIWVLDGLEHRLLVWQAGRPTRPTRSVRLPSDLNVRDFVLGPDDTIYATTGSDARRPNLYALTPTGRVRWKARTTIAVGNARLHMSPDGTLYTPSGGNPPAMGWTQLTTSSGRPFSLAQQRRRTGPLQPLSDGLRLLETHLSEHEVHFALVNRQHKIVRAWRITSRTQLGAVRATPALVGDDLVVPLGATRQMKRKFLWEYFVLRLTPTGVARRHLSLDAHAVAGDESESTPLRVAPDGWLYQLRTNRKTGMTVARYSIPS